MVKLLSIPILWVLTFVAMTGAALAQGWFLQTSGTTQLLEGVSFADANIGTVVGHQGTILRTTDGGATWVSQSSGTTKDLEGVWFVNSLVGTAVGEGGKILRTTDGGATWVSQSSGTLQKLEGVVFLNENIGNVVGNSGVILRTTDGGTTWISQTSGTTRRLDAVWFINANTGTAVGERGTILRTTNSGSTWVSQNSGVTNNLFGVSFGDANNGIAVGAAGTVLRTTNGGATWISQPIGVTGSLRSVWFVDQMIGTIVGDGGVIFRTTDGGMSWSSQVSGTTQELRFVQFTDANVGTAVGASGTILRTTTGGGGAMPIFSVTPSSLAFGNVVVGQAKQDSVVVTNTGTSALTITSVVSDNGEFSVSPTSGSIPPSGSQKFYIVFAPGDAGAEAGNIVFVHDAAGSPDTVAVSGTGVAPGFSVSPASVSFGNVVVGQTKQDSVVVTNTGTSALTITSVVSDNGEFSVSPTSGSIPPSGSQKFYIVFAPGDAGAEAGNIVFVHDAAGSPDTVAVSGTGVVPGFSVSPASVSFGNVVVGQAKQDSVVVTNTGTSALTITSVVSDNGEFSVSPTSGSIPPSGSQKFYIVFAPGDAGAEAGNIVFVHDAAGSPDTVAVSGTGVAPGFSVSPASVSFGNVVVGQAKQDSVVVTNTGTSALTITSVVSDNGEFSVSPTSGSIPPSGSQKFYIVFAPGDAGAEAGNIVFVHDAAGSPDTVTVSGTGVAPGFSVSPASVSFGNVVVGQAKQDSVEVTNTGTSALTITSVVSDNGEFSVSPTSGSIPPSGSQKFYIVFAPGDAGAEAGNIVFVHDAAGSPDTVAVSGTGVAPGFSVSPASVSFGNVVVGQTKQDSVVVTNTGTSALTITSVVSDNGEFSVSPTSGSIPPSGSQKFYITFAPTNTGAETGNIIFTHDASGSPHSVAVNGTGVAPGFSVSPTSVAFGNVIVGSSKQDSVEVTNTGTSTLTISSVTSDNAEFSVTPTSGSIPVSSSQKFYITFSPTNTGAESGNITFNHDAAGSPHSVAVSGAGVAPGFSVSPASVAFGNVVVGSSKLDSVLVTNTGTSVLTIFSVTSDNAEFNVTPTGGSIAPSGSEKFYVSFSPTNTGPESGSVTFTHDAAGSPHSVAVSGIGVAPAFFVTPTSIAFGDTTVGAEKVDSVTVSNPGSSTLTISSVVSDNPEYTVSPTSGSVAPSASQKFYITFTPADTGASSGHVIFTHDASSSPDTVAVSGNGLPIEIVATFLTGWEMISNPVTTSNDSVRHLFPTADFDYVYAFSNGGYELSYRIENRRGYWSRFSAPLTNMVTGIPRSVDTFFVDPGWNLVGSISYPVDIGTIISIPPNLRTSEWVGYAGGYVPTDTIVPGKGYWVRANSAGQFVLYRSPSRLTSGGNSPKKGTNPLEGLNTITITDVRGHTQTLYFGNDAGGVIPLARYDMPPVPPLGSFDARFETPEGGSRVRTHNVNATNDVRFPIRIQAVEYPLTITWNIKNNSLYVLTDGSGSGAFISHEMRGEGTMRIDNTEVNRLVLQWNGITGVPTEFALYQNYPNPFNPTTTIKFALPVESKVCAEIYNILGQHVATIVNDVLSAGYHSVEWNGRSGAGQTIGNGVYFVRLMAKDGTKTFTDVRKLLLIK